MRSYQPVRLSRLLYLPLSFKRLTPTTMPKALLILLGISSSNLRALGIPITFPLSSQPINNFPPWALAQPQIHSKYSSFHLLFHSMFCFQAFYYRPVRLLYIVINIILFLCRLFKTRMSILSIYCLKNN